MSNFSLTIFGPEDGYKQFTIPNSSLIPDDSFKINPSDFDFRIGGKLLQVIRINDKAYISLHQQVFQVNGERPGYTFGEAIYFEISNFNISIILKNIYELHAAFTHVCINEFGRFDGFKFVNQYRSTQKSKFDILKNEFDNNLTAVSNSPVGNLFSNAKSAYFVTESLEDISNIHKIVTWMLESVGSLKYSRLLIIDSLSGIPSEDFTKINNLDSENSSVLSFIYSAYSNCRIENSNLEKVKSDLIIENNSLIGKNQELNSKLLNLNKTNSLQSIQPPSRVVVSQSNASLSLIEQNLEAVKSELVRLKGATAKIQDGVALVADKTSSQKGYLLINVVLSFFMMLVVGFLLYEINSIASKNKNIDELLQNVASEQTKQMREIKNNLSKSLIAGEDPDPTLQTPSSKPSTKKENTKKSIN